MLANSKALSTLKSNNLKDVTMNYQQGNIIILFLNYPQRLYAIIQNILFCILYSTHKWNQVNILR